MLLLSMNSPKHFVRILNFYTSYNITLLEIICYFFPTRWQHPTLTRVIPRGSTWRAPLTWWHLPPRNPARSGRRAPWRSKPGTEGVNEHHLPEPGTRSTRQGHTTTGQGQVSTSLIFGQNSWLGQATVLIPPGPANKVQDKRSHTNCTGT